MRNSGLNLTLVLFLLSHRLNFEVNVNIEVNVNVEVDGMSVGSPLVPPTQRMHILNFASHLETEFYLIKSQIHFFQTMSS